MHLASRLSLFLLWLLSAHVVPAQVAEWITSEGITSPLHEANIGRITFMGKPIPIEAYKETDFLGTFEIKPKTDLNLRVYLASSLTNYLHLLASNLTAEELVQKGNFQFTFLVDDQVVYVENLVPGAGSPVTKNTKTVFRVPLLSSTNEDAWGRFLWNRFMMSGGQEALSGGSHTLEIVIRPYVALPEAIVGKQIASGKIEVTVFTQPVQEKEVAMQEIAPKSGFPASEQQMNNDLIRQMNTKIAEGTFKDITGIVVLKEGKLLLEEYFNGAKRSSLHDTRSVGKSIAAILTGLAVQDGFVKPDLRLGDVYPMAQYANPSARKDSVTLRQLLCMTSGFAGSDMDDSSPGNEEKMYPTKDWLRFALDLPMDASKTPGRDWQYFTAGTIIVGDILNRKIPGGLEAYAQKRLFGPLGITKFKWQYTPQKVVNTAGGIQMRALDLARIGLFYESCLHQRPAANCAFNPDWIQSTFSHQAQIPGTENEYYGYFLWNKTYTVGGNSHEVYYASGNGGNKIFIFKDRPLVVVITAKAYNKPYAHAQADKILQQYLIPAF